MQDVKIDVPWRPSHIGLKNSTVFWNMQDDYNDDVGNDNDGNTFWLTVQSIVNKPIHNAKSSQVSSKNQQKWNKEFYLENKN